MKALITGATGFLGGALTCRLHKMGWHITALGRNVSKLKQLETQGIRAVQVNLEDEHTIINVCEEQEIVFHCAALPSPWGKYEAFYQANVIGTRNIIRGCEENKVKRLVYVSTPSLYFGYGSRINVKETDPLPSPVSHYAATKILAEQELDRAFANGLATIAIRPRAIFGPGDTVIFPRLIPRLQSGTLPILGDGENIVDLTYIENVVDALLLCVESPANTLGKKYNISNGESIKLWDMIERICKELNFIFPTRKIPRRPAHLLAHLLEHIYRIIPHQPEPPLTRISVSMMANSTTLDITAAKTELGYQPRVTVDEGFDKFMQWWKENQENLRVLRG